MHSPRFSVISFTSHTSHVQTQFKKEWYRNPICQQLHQELHCRHCSKNCNLEDSQKAVLSNLNLLMLCREMEPPPARREALPTPKQKDENSSIWSLMWSILKESLGKDLTHITLPFFFNEPLSVLQKTMEDLEYADLLNKVPTVICRH